MTVIWLVDDDAGVLRGLQRLLAAEGYTTRACPDAQTFLDTHDPTEPGCAVVDLGLPGLDGLALQARLQTDGQTRPIIFLTGQGTVPAAVKAMRDGAVDFLTKPVDAPALLAAIDTALIRDADGRARSHADATLRSRLATLTPREREVLTEVVAGRLNKQIADRLGAAEKTIKVHRGRMMHKMGVRSVAELVTLCARHNSDSTS
jgi:FixJ family two-component response regulator